LCDERSNFRPALQSAASSWHCKVRIRRAPPARAVASSSASSS
jgi:hypothetical protein